MHFGRRMRKVLINPTVTYDDLNMVSEFARMNTYGFFDQKHEADYNLFQSVYPHVVWCPGIPHLRLIDVKDVVKEIIQG